MFVIKRNQVIVTALVVMIAVAGYLNFTESKGSESGKNVQNAMMLTEEGDAYTALVPEGDIETIADDVEDLDVAKTDVAEPDAVAADAQAALDPITAEATVAAEDGKTDDTGAAIFVNANNDPSTYFVQAKLEREQARAKEKDILTEMINNANVAQEQKASCADSMLEIQKRIEKETAAEAMIKSKGFKEAYVRIDDKTVDVVVEKSELTESEVAQIMDIVTRKTGVAEDGVRISPLKK